MNVEEKKAAFLKAAMALARQWETKYGLDSTAGIVAQADFIDAYRALKFTEAAAVLEAQGGDSPALERRKEPRESGGSDPTIERASVAREASTAPAQANVEEKKARLIEAAKAYVLDDNSYMLRASTLHQAVEELVESEKESASKKEDAGT